MVSKVPVHHLPAVSFPQDLWKWQCTAESKSFLLWELQGCMGIHTMGGIADMNEQERKNGNLYKDSVSSLTDDLKSLGSV